MKILYLTQISVQYDLKMNVSGENTTPKAKYRIYLGNVATKVTYKAQEALPSKKGLIITFKSRVSIHQKITIEKVKRKSTNSEEILAMYNQLISIISEELMNPQLKIHGKMAKQIKNNKHVTEKA